MTDGTDPTTPGLGLGLDAGGTHTRWALASADGRVRAGGDIAPMSGQQLASEAGLAALTDTLHTLAAQVASQSAACGGGLALAGLVAGITGFDSQQMPQWQALAAHALGLPVAGVRALSDIELTCAAAFAPGQGMVLIAGTGSVAAFVDSSGQMHRAGGRGAIIDDAGGGHWLARHALQQIWRAEDAEPGGWQRSALARHAFEYIGGTSWAHTRAWVYGASRGELGTLAQAVAAAADDGDAAATALLQQAGQELARLVLALAHRVGWHPLALSGRVFDLHPTITASLQQALRAAGPNTLQVQRLDTLPHHAAARLAASPASATNPSTMPH